MPAPPLGREQQAILDQLQAAPSPAFEEQYVIAQVDGHQKLRAIQDRYLSSGTVPGVRHVAMLARGQIKEHLRLLNDIRRRRA